ILLTIFVAGVLALLLTGVAAFFWFMFLGSANVVNSLFSLQLSKKELILMSTVYLAFIFTIDNVFKMMVTLLTSQILMFNFLFFNAMVTNGCFLFNRRFFSINSLYEYCYFWRSCTNTCFI